MELHTRQLIVTAMRGVYTFMSDVPHLMKTTRNCWYSSRTGGARYMWVRTYYNG